jgi:hypothetical protein
MDMDQIDKEIEQQMRRTYTPQSAASPSPATPPSQPPSGQFAELMQTMIAIEQWKGQILANDRAREHQIETRIRAQVEREVTSTSTDPTDQLMLEAGREFLGAWRQTRQNPFASPPVKKPSQTVQAATTTTDAQPAPSNEAEDMFKLTQEKADAYADKIFESFPQEVLATQRGEITEADAIAKIIEGTGGKANAEHAKMIYDSIMATDYNGTPDEATK